jgi:hypothetical protein
MGRWETVLERQARCQTRRLTPITNLLFMTVVTHFNLENPLIGPLSLSIAVPNKGPPKPAYYLW